MNTHTDIAIIEDCLKGDQLAFKQLYERYIPYCYGICNRYAIHQSDIKDVVQVIFSHVFHSLKNYDREKSKFKTWFTHVCINQILSYKKKQGRMLYTQSFEDVGEMNYRYAENPIEENIDRKYILSLLQKMPNNYQIVFNMFVIDGYSHDEIAEKLNISSASSRVIVSRARGWVKEKFIKHLKTAR